MFSQLNSGLVIEILMQAMIALFQPQLPSLNQWEFILKVSVDPKKYCAKRSFYRNNSLFSKYVNIALLRH